MTTIESEYARLKALAEKATPGPWKYDDGRTDGDERGKAQTVACAKVDPLLFGKLISEVYSHENIADTDRWCPFLPESDANGAFIASAHDMMALIERLREENQHLQRSAEAHKAWLEKTDWAREVLPHKYIGWHLADAIKDAFDRLMAERQTRDAGPSAFGGRKTDRSRT